MQTVLVAPNLQRRFVGRNAVGRWRSTLSRSATRDDYFDDEDDDDDDDDVDDHHHISQLWQTLSPNAHLKAFKPLLLIPSAPLA